MGTLRNAQEAARIQELSRNRGVACLAASIFMASFLCLAGPDTAEAQVACPENLDVVLVIDNSLSMRWPTDYLAEVKDELDDFLDYLDTNSLARASLISFTQCVTVDSALTDNMGTVKGALGGLGGGGGCAEEEVSDTALNTILGNDVCVKEGSFDEPFRASRKVVILITDELPGTCSGINPCTCAGAGYPSATAAEFRAAGIKIVAVQVGDNEGVGSALMPYATGTQGAFIHNESGVGLGQQLKDLPLLQWSGSLKITFSKNPLVPGAGSRSEAKIDTQESVTWSIEGDALGCKIDQNGVIVHDGRTMPSRHKDSITVKAVIGNCVTRAKLRLGCPSGNCSGNVCDASVTPSGSAMVYWPLGQANSGQSLGGLILHAKGTEEDPFALGSAGLVEYSVRHDEAVVTYDDDEVIEQVVTPQMAAYITPVTATSFDLELKSRTGGGEQTAAIYRVTGVEEDPDALQVIKKDPQGNTLRIYEFTSVSGNTVLTTKDAGGTPLLSEEKAVDGMMETITTRDELDTIISIETQTYYQFAWARELISARQGDVDGPTTTYDYWESVGANYGKMKSVQNADGSWVYYASYNGEGRILTEYHAWQDEALTEPPSTRRTRSYVYYDEQLHDADDDGAYPERPRDITETIDSVIVSKTFYRHEEGNESGYTLNIETNEQACSPTAAFGDSGNIRTVTKTHKGGSLDERLFSVEKLHDLSDVYSYRFGNYNDETHAFTEDAYGTAVEETVEHLSDGAGIVNESTKEVTITDEFARQVISETHVCTTAPHTYALVERTIREYDSQGRIEHIIYPNGTEWLGSYENGCCGLTSETNPDGTITEYPLYDDLGRLERSVKVGVSASGNYPAQTSIYTNYTYDALGRAVMTVTSDSETGTSGLRLWTETEYDTAGRVMSRSDQTGIDTTYDYDEAVNGARIVEETRGGTTVKTTYYLDGRVKSVTDPDAEADPQVQSCVVPRYYSYGVDQTASGIFSLESTGVATNSPFWRKTITDCAGRVVREESPGGTTNAYTVVRASVYALDRLVRVETTDGTNPLVADTLYTYDALGNVLLTGLDVNDNGTLDLASSDRITVSDGGYTNAAGAWWRVNSTTVFPLTGYEDSLTLNTHKERLSGFTNDIIQESMDIDVHGNYSTTTVTLDAEYALQTTLTQHSALETFSASQVTRNGLLQASSDPTGVSATYGYDALGRQTSTTDSRGNIQQTDYNDEGQVEETIDGASQSTTYVYSPTTGRLVSVTNPASKTRYTSYTRRGEVERVWGDTDYPVEYVYDLHGRKIEMHTYRGGSGWDGTSWPGQPGPADVTQWVYSHRLLTSKVDAAGKAVQYTYTADDKLYTRKWARQSGALVTTYGYNASTGEMTGISYSDATPDVTFTHNRVGQQVTVTDAVGTRTFGYNDVLQLATESVNPTGGGLYSRLLTRKNETYDGAGGFMPGRDAGFMVGTALDPDEDYDITYSYWDLNNNRLTKITGPGLPPYGVVYSHLSGSNLVETVSYMTGSSTTVAATERQYDPYRDLLTEVINTVEGLQDPATSFGYTLDNLGSRVRVQQGGEVAGDLWTGWGYNDRRELTDSERYVGVYPDDSEPLTTEDFEYGYDPIGNRDYSQVGADDPTLYTTNSLNQYPAITYPSQRFYYDADGNLTGESDPAGDGPVLVSATSVKTHGAAGDFGLPIPLTLPDAAGVESRSGGPTAVDLEFSEAVSISTGNVALTTGSCSAVNDLGDNVYRLVMSGTTNNAVLTIALSNVASVAASLPLVGVTEIKIVVMRSDANRSTQINVFDLILAHNFLNDTVTAESVSCDIDLNGTIEEDDLEQIRDDFGYTVSPPTLPAGPSRLYTYDCENRLIRVEPACPIQGSTKSEFVYDYMGRRARKTWSTYDAGTSTWTEEQNLLFIYDGWNIVLVLDADAGDVLTKYTWGLDLSGLNGSGVGPASSRSSEGIHGAGGIGGLLAAVDTAGTTTTTDDHQFWYFYDGNGNVAHIVNGTDQQTPELAAYYEYDPYGNLLVAAQLDQSTIAQDNPFRFSTKWLDSETGLIYFGRRYLRDGRWINRDPIEEEGGLHLYAFAANDPINQIDPFGLWGEDMHYYETLKVAKQAGFKDERCAKTIAKWNRGVDTWTQLILEYHFDFDVNGNPYGCGRGCHYQRRWEDGLNRLKTAKSKNEVIRGLQRIGEALHSAQDGYSHRLGGQLSKKDQQPHLARTPFDHAPDLYCFLWGDWFGILIPRCIDAKQHNPNWGETSRPDNKNYFPDDFREASAFTLEALKSLVEIETVKCHCCN